MAEVVCADAQWEGFRSDPSPQPALNVGAVGEWDGGAGFRCSVY